MEQKMEYIYAVYQEGSISRAAQKLFISQPALSLAIQRVEKSLGRTIFDRSHSPLRLTRVGELYIQKYHEIKRLEREFENQVNDLYDLKKGTLIMGGTQFILSYIFAPVLTKFSRQYPQITIQLLECRSDTAQSLLLEGSIDTYLRASPCASSLRPIGKAFVDHLLIAVPKHYQQEHDLPPERLTMDMVVRDEHLHAPHADFLRLSKLPFLQLSPGNNLHNRIIELFREHGAVPEIKMQVEQFATSCFLADSGMGATLVSAMMIKQGFGHNLFFYKVNSPLLVREFYFVGRQKGYISSSTKSFMQMLHGWYSY